MRYAKASDLKAIYSHFRAHRNVFPHVRQDALKRRIAARQCIYQDGVVVTFQRYKKRTRVGDVQVPAGSIMLHQILNCDQFNGAGSRVFRQFVEEIVKPSGGDLYLSVRKANAVACRFYERNGMAVAGNVFWSGGLIPGRVYRLKLTEPSIPQQYLEFTVYFINPELNGRVLLEGLVAALQSRLGGGIRYQLRQQRRRHYWKVQFDCSDLSITEEDIRERLSTVDATFIECDAIERRVAEVPVVPPTLHMLVGSPSPEFVAAWQADVKRLKRQETKKRSRLNAERRDRALYPSPS